MSWETLPSLGYSYFEVYTGVNAAGIVVDVGWVLRGVGAPHYAAWFSNGKQKAGGTRGSFVAARKFVTDLYKQYGA